MRAPFIVLEGIDGAGTTTQRSRLCDRLGQLGPVHPTAEPSSGPVGKLIRSLLSAQSDPVSPEAMALLFAADRRDHLAREVVPKLEAGVPVVSDRYAVSSMAYQSAVGVDNDFILGANFGGEGILRPDLTILVEVPIDVATQRRAARAGTVEIYDDAALQDLIALRYRGALRYLEQNRGWVCSVVDGSGCPDKVHEAIWAAIRTHLTGRFCELARCPSCDGPTSRSTETQQFLYGYPESAMLSAQVPVYTCGSCGEAFTDGEGEKARDAAVRSHLAQVTSPPPG